MKYLFMYIKYICIYLPQYMLLNLGFIALDNDTYFDVRYT